MLFYREKEKKAVKNGQILVYYLQYFENILQSVFF